MSELLEVRSLRVRYGTGSSSFEALQGVDLSVGAGEIVALVGESGSGKSTLAHSIVRLLPDAARIDAGSIAFDGTELTRTAARALRRIRGAQIGFVPQDPSHSLNPLMRVGEQIAETLRRHTPMLAAAAAARAVEILAEVGVPEPERRAKQYPHELSGGLRQRVLIGIAWSCNPRLVIADEPTSALDATVQRHVLDRMQSLARSHGTAVLLVTHDLAIAADRADRIVVLNAGEVVESGNAAEVLAAPAHPYTQRLVEAAPGAHPSRLQPSVSGSAPAASLPAAPVEGDVLLRVRGLRKSYGSGRTAAAAPAVDGVSFDVERGTTFALVGESGSGKSTTARMVARVIDADEGDIVLDGEPIAAARGRALRALRKRMQIVYQNPFGSLDPRMPVARLIAEPLRAFGVGDAASQRAAVDALLEQVRLSPSLASRRPAELSGGQRQRVAIARALALRPELLVLDEPVSALDVSVQHQVLQLLVDLQAEFSLTYLFISHDLGVVRQIADTVAVMRHGTICEAGESDRIFDAPTHPYTRELIAAIPGREHLLP